MHNKCLSNYSNTTKFIPISSLKSQIKMRERVNKGEGVENYK